MRLLRLGIVAIAVLAPSFAYSYEKPYDPNPWCAAYAFGATDCGFLTLEQCRAAVSGVGGFCEPNQFYNPRRSAPRRDRR